MCIGTVHYCCHRNVMHRVSYRQAQLFGMPCLICSGSCILILFWKGIVNTVWRRDRRREGKEEMEEQERKRRLDPPVGFSYNLFSNLYFVHWHVVWIDDIHTFCYVLSRAHDYILSPSVTRRVLVSRKEADGAFQRRCWYSLCGDNKDFISDGIDAHRIWGQEFSIKHRINCTAFIPTGHISYHVDLADLDHLCFISLFSWRALHLQVLFFSVWQSNSMTSLSLSVFYFVFYAEEKTTLKKQINL